MLLLPDRIDTPRLVLRAFRPEDVPRFVPLIGEWEVARWLARVPYPYREADGSTWVALSDAMRADGSGLNLLAVRRADGQPVGGVGLTVATGEIGYWLGRPYQGAGYGTEMAGALVRAAFDAVGLDTVFAFTDPANDRSRRVLETLGFAYGGLREHDFALRGGLRPAHHYHLTAARWRDLNRG
ncbi:GNAT family N-acetyltransferase [Azospirillum sp.]|uniref:GNAT family N-acetyltransferase n=1 Tax=Azospirillum sp. TaxID=34012 RepID=UPI002D59B26D|nr:GNAT family N-acetyltransferase [Azospirillum sp.]HYD68857.1 GNAT family N-acetyltransferase [Azospirillum sp.]